MDVSNSTGQNTGYRVMGSAGGSQRPAEGAESKRGKGKAGKDRPSLKAPAPPEELHSGDLEPNTYVTLTVPGEYDCTVVFLRDQKVIAEQKVQPGDLLIALVPNGKGAPKPVVCRRKA